MHSATVIKFFYTPCGSVVKQPVSNNETSKLKCDKACRCEVDVKLALKSQDKYFCYISLKSWLDFIIPKLFDKMVFRSSLESQQTGRVYKDIVNGREYDRITAGEDMITLTLGWDGVKYSESPAKSFWPLVGYINELEYSVRIRNGLVLAIHASSNASQAMFKPLIDELIEFEANPFEVKIEGDSKFFKVRILVIVADAPARAKILNMQDFSSKHGCNQCTIKTFWVSASRYPLTEHAPLRSNEEWRQEAENATPDHPWYGIKGKCELSRLHYVDLSKVCPPEYLHSQEIGTQRALLECWLGKNPVINKKVKEDPTYHKYCYISGNKAQVLRNRLETVGFPSRKCRSMPDLANISKAKAYDLENFMLYGHPALQGILPDEVYKHYLKYVYVMASLNGPRITEATLRHCRHLVDEFLQEFSQHYPVELQLYNVHTIDHLPFDVEQFGPLLHWSAFPTENSMGMLSRRVMTFTRVAEQVLNKIVVYSSIYYDNVYGKFSDLSNPIPSLHLETLPIIGRSFYRHSEMQKFQEI